MGGTDVGLFLQLIELRLADGSVFGKPIFEGLILCLSE